MKNILFLLFSFSCFGQIVLIKHKAYEIHFDTKLKEPIYTYYILTKSMLNGNNERTAFHFDNSISNNEQNSNSLIGYDKGHLSPNDDFRADSTTELESMVYTNEAPQISSFNRGIWHSLENYVRKLALKNNIEVWTGCIYKNSNIPLYYWKLLKINGVYEGYLMPNLITTKGQINNYKTNTNELLKIIKK